MKHHSVLAARAVRSPALAPLMLIAGFAIAVGPAAVLAAPKFTVTPSPSFVSVLEGDSGVFNFTVKNVGIDDITIDEVRLPFNLVSFSIDFVSGDKNDEVFNVQIVNAANCVGKILSTGGTCVFKELFDTRDLKPAESGTNVGIWLIGNTVVLIGAADIPENRVNGSAKVEVRDQGAIATIPGPETYSMLLAGLGLLGFLSRRGKLQSA